MKKMLYLLYLLIFLTNYCFSQSYIRDAIKLSRLTPESELDKKTACEILGVYISATDGITIDGLKRSYDDNPFITFYLSKFKNNKVPGTQTADKNGLVSMESTNNTNISSSTNGVNSANSIGIMSIDAVSKILLKSSKENAVIYLLDNFDAFMKDPSIESKYLAILFPKTKSLIDNNFISSGYQIGNTLQILRETFSEDFSNLISHIPDIIELAGVDKKDDRLMLIRLCTNIYTSIRSDNKFPDIIDKLSANKFNDSNITDGLRFLSLANITLRESSNNENIWINSNELKEFFSKPDKYNIFIGLVYQVYKDQDILGAGTIKDLLTNNEGIEPNNVNVKRVIENYTLISESIDEMQTTLKALKDKKKSVPLEATDYVNITARFIDITLSVFKMKKIGSDDALVDPNVTKQLSETKESILKITNSLLEKNFLSVFSQSLFYFQSFNNSITNSKLSKLIKYGSFIALMCSAKSQEDVDNIVESIVLPSGSFKMKRNVRFNFGINGYIGFFGGNEWRNQTIFKGRGNAGLTAPVGLEIAWSPFADATSLSLFMPLIDIAAPVTYRSIENNKEIELPEFTVTDLVSPGLYAILGYNNIPLSFGIGLQYGPLFKKFVDNNMENKKLWRIGAFIAFDIPLVNFYTKPKN